MVNDRQSLGLTTFARPTGGGDVEWRISPGPVPYPEAVAEMEARVADIAANRARELVWLRYHGELGSQEIAAKLAWKEPAVRVALSKARTFMRSSLRNLCSM